MRDRKQGAWLDEEGPNGQPRPEGNRDMLQLRFVAPVPLGKNLKLINRVTMRNNEAVDKSSGAGHAEYFALFMPFEWSTGRWASDLRSTCPRRTRSSAATSDGMDLPRRGSKV